MPEGAVQEAVEALRGVRTWDEYGVVARALIDIGSPAVPLLLQALSDSDERVVKYAAAALGEIGDFRAIAPLQDLRTRCSPEIHGVIEQSLRILTRPPEFFTARTLEQSLETLRSWSDYARFAEASMSGGEELVEPLLALLDRPNARVRKFAAALLGELGSPAHMTSLIRLAEGDPDPEVRRVASRSVERLAQ
jgi:HEAT repeat protein